MASPLINEGMILGILDAPPSSETAVSLQTGSLLAILDGFDRQIKREEFVNMSNEAIGLHNACARLDSLASMLRLLKEGKLDETLLNRAVTNLSKMAEKHRSALQKQMELVAQCPWDDDAKH